MVGAVNVWGAIILFIWAVVLHAGIGFLVFTAWGLPVFVLYSGAVTGALAWADMRHRNGSAHAD